MHITSASTRLHKEMQVHFSMLVHSKCLYIHFIVLLFCVCVCVVVVVGCWGTLVPWKVRVICQWMQLKQVRIEPRQLLVLVCLLWLHSLFGSCQWHFFTQWYTCKECSAAQQCITQWQMRKNPFRGIWRIGFLQMLFYFLKKWNLIEC